MEKVEELYDKKVQCPVCNQEFITNKVRTSKLRLIKRDSDFLTYYEGENPIKYNVFVCQHCGYASMEDKFHNINSKEKKIILDKVSSKWNKRSFSGRRSIEKSIEAYKLSLYCGQLLNFEKYNLANICLRTAWLYRIKKDSNEEKRFLHFTLDLYREAYYNEYLTDSTMDELTLTYLIGEISRRLGKKEEALNWFNNVLRNPEIKDNRVIERMTREQWQLAKES
ncbi:DUF2225 domain-containing protein [Anaerosalibacter bizertensis]|uniref:DUF2225 domain-containing protein n=1 Tax=Anaerosalibacter bizertensis TaxID=932217 RepID=A0A9Q4AD08_9FIRM|nr:DUF2225 domain-containing protein [Anaerosalibacter bizertensis]MBV1818100.1 DUF2225 domain-containing protein [Bacteroidales bacterium MSK.15.36]MCB5559882.1 DUF2225 domain-containing protein [Anaerosalibacter bizertensis]MCG4565411.1 DUF2225 domain-containing protein [Anaerosalibacter bizertensis]MCG4582389.1 DUF2225 domain-containing protein [Anaerosalibacter bizertensis]MCG4585525.1 DUF2225 domain-containing protein [Anaerosalibacter bizertensis]